MASVLWLGCKLYLISTIALFRKYKVEESLKKINFHLCEELASLTQCLPANLPALEHDKNRLLIKPFNGLILISEWTNHV